MIAGSCVCIEMAIASSIGYISIVLQGMHASASPFEGLAERANWLEAEIKDDAFGKQLLAAGTYNSIRVLEP